MILGIHIGFALISLFYSTYVAIVPSEKKLKFSYLFIFGTLTSGVVLSLGQGISIVQVCISGLAYTGFVIISVLLAKRKITSIKTL